MVVLGSELQQGWERYFQKLKQVEFVNLSSRFQQVTKIER